MDVDQSTELVEKSNQDLRVLNQYLEDEVREVSSRLREEEWKSFGLETRLVQMEARQQIMMERLDAMNVAPVVVDLTNEEDEGGLGGPIFLAPYGVSGFGGGAVSGSSGTVGGVGQHPVFFHLYRRG